MADNNSTVQDSISLTAGFVLLLWSVRLVESLLGVSFTGIGVFPQTASGLIGIATAPLIHSSWEHLISNTLPILLLGSMLLYGYPNSRWRVLLLVWFGSGAGVWLFARSSYHIGASGLAHGMFFFLLIAGILRRDKRSIALLMIAFFMYGTMIWTVFPYEPGVSFESHLFGGLAGAVCAVLFRQWDPLPAVKTYPWEGDVVGELEEDDLIGDEWRVDLPTDAVQDNPRHEFDVVASLEKFLQWCRRR